MFSKGKVGHGENTIKHLEQCCTLIWKKKITDYTLKNNVRKSAASLGICRFFQQVIDLKYTKWSDLFQAETSGPMEGAQG